MKCSKRSLAVSVLFAALMSLLPLIVSTRTLNARNADLAYLIFAGPLRPPITNA